MGFRGVKRLTAIELLLVVAIAMIVGSVAARVCAGRPVFDDANGAAGNDAPLPVRHRYVIRFGPGNSAKP